MDLTIVWSRWCWQLSQRASNCQSLLPKRNHTIEKGWIEKLSLFLPAPNLPLDQFLPYVVVSLSGKRRSAIGSDEGFCLARVGYSQEEADMLSVAAADFSGFMLRQKQRGWAVESQAISFFQQVDLLIPETSFVFLCIELADIKEWYR